MTQPFLLGMLLAAGFETASQLSALILAGRVNPWLFGAVFDATLERLRIVIGVVS